MSIISIISVCVSVIGCLVGGGVIWKMIDIGRQNGKMEQRIITLEARTEEDRKHDAGKFDRLYEGKNEANERLIRIETMLNLLLEEVKNQKNKES